MNQPGTNGSDPTIHDTAGRRRTCLVYFEKNELRVGGAIVLRTNRIRAAVKSGPLKYPTYWIEPAPEAEADEAKAARLAMLAERRKNKVRA